MGLLPEVLLAATVDMSREPLCTRCHTTKDNKHKRNLTEQMVLRGHEAGHGKSKKKATRQNTGSVAFNIGSELGRGKRLRRATKRDGELTADPIE